MRRLAALLVVLAAALAGCGGNDSRLLPSTEADALKDTLESIRQAVSDRDVSACAARVRELRGEIGNLGPPIDRELRQRLRQEVVEQLAPRVEQQCDDPKTERIPTTTTPAPTGPTGPATTTESEPTDPAEPPPAPTATSETVPTPTVEPDPTVPPLTETTPAPEPDTGGFSDEELEEP